MTNSAHVGLVSCSQSAPAGIPPAPGQSQTCMQKEELQNQTLVQLFVGKEARSKSREWAASALLFELLSKMRLSQNNLIVYFLGWIVLYLLMSIKLMFSENGPTWLAELFAEHQCLI